MAGDDGILAGARRTFAAVAVFSLFGNLLILAVPLYTLQIYDRVLSSRSGETLALLAVIAAGALAVHAVLEAVRSRLMVHAGLWLDRAWAPALLVRGVRRGATGESAAGASLLRDLAVVRGVLTGAAVFHLFDSPWVPVYVAVMFLLHPALGWLTTGGALVLFGLAIASEYATRTPLRAAGLRVQQAQARADDCVRRAEVIEAMGMLGGIIADWRTEAARTEALTGRGLQRAALLTALARFGRFFIQIAVLTLGAWLAINDQLSAGAIVAGSIILARALAPVESLVGSWRSVIAARAALARIAAELQRPAPRRATTRLPVPGGRLTLDRVTVEVPGRERPVLAGIDLALAPGESLGVIGASAAGKTTLARVVLGILAPNRGCARLDGADLATWDRDDLGRHIGYLPQDVELFPGSVKRNIARMGKPDDALVVAAAQAAGVHEMVLRLPLGYDTEIGEAVRNLSGGQRQRIAIARAFYGSPRLLVLDEPNSNLDSEGENALIRALLRARGQGVTTLVIAHRARVLMTVDRLLLLKEGRMEMLGPREEVMARVLPQPGAPAAGRLATAQGAGA
ncbi:type I secretion system permease/ATPase [Magnetospirillum sp. UT-4]|uniref:type I secretion system permease/ATPase n=1 Tax=Magnetospirillum sp. UT-4 TaxID=2681467 RepID=UPI001383997B|nr:type I secretion system permease/ATPase [Magnetospirillum sp. UT-4]CAA7619664.1 Alkaline protease secretion ATP-binding protein AprD [Magnetospirillum sp. UT-4]